ncbi:MAG: MerR family transcriptional regulator [Bacteroidia bacterium]|nr:MerR family transcriptional regulator [Bacteroidia bacterium]
MLINELSKRTGVSIHTLRYYENLGLISGAVDETVTTNRYKNYGEDALERVEIIREGKEAGFTLAEIKKMLESWYSGTLTPEEQLKTMDKKIAEVENRIRKLKDVKKLLVRMRKEIGKGEC